MVMGIGRARIRGTRAINVIQVTASATVVPGPDDEPQPDGDNGQRPEGGDAAGDGSSMPAELDPSHLRVRLVQLAGILGIVVLVLWLAPGLGQLRTRLDRASAAWLAVGAAMELLSTLSYVVVFRSVFCHRMTWRMSYQIGMAEQAANSLLPAGGAGGLALGAWALRRGGMAADHIARRSVAFFLLTSLANVGGLILFAAAIAVGVFGPVPAPGVTFGVAGAGVLGTVIVLCLPALISRYSSRRAPLPPDAARLRVVLRHAVDALGDGVGDALVLLRQNRVGAVVGSLGYLAFDIAALGASFAAFGRTPAFGVLVVAYIIGQLGGLLPVPGGIGGVEGGLIGTFAIYHVSLTAASVAVLAYRALALWIPAMLGSVAFVQLRRTLREEADAAAICQPLAEPLELIRLPASRSAAPSA